MSDLDESQEEIKKGRGKKRKRDDRGRISTFIVYKDSAHPDWIARLDALHVRAFISPLHDADFLKDGVTPCKPHWHVILYFDGKKSRGQIDAIREAAIGPDFNRELQNVDCAGAMARYLCHMDNPEKAQYRREDVIALGGADYDLATSMPGDDSVVMAAISAYVVSAEVTNVNALIKICKAEGRRDWMSYISRHGYVVGMIIGQNVQRLERIRNGTPLRGDIVFGDGGGAAADEMETFSDGEVCDG